MQIIGMLVGVLGLSVIALNLGGDMPLAGFVCILIAAMAGALVTLLQNRFQHKRRSKDQTGLLFRLILEVIRHPRCVSRSRGLGWSDRLCDFNAIFSHI